MSDQGRGYHLGYETTKAYQAEMRGVEAQERCARQAQAAHHASAYARLMALVHHAYSRVWSTKMAAAAETGASPDVPVVLR